MARRSNTSNFWSKFGPFLKVLSGTLDFLIFFVNSAGGEKGLWVEISAEIWKHRFFIGFLKVGVKMGPYFPAKCAKTARGVLQNERLGVLQRIQRIQRKRIQACRTDPRFPTPGGRMTVIYTNSLKLCWNRGLIS